MANEAESGHEVVLDNRKLIIVFGLLIAVCICVFVLGFVEGKRQGFQEGSQTAGESLPKAMPETTLAQTAKPAQAKEETASPKPDPADQPLDWYKNISRSSGAPEPVQPAAEPKVPAASPPMTAPIPAAKPKPKATAEPAVTYSVQVGAFNDKHQMDVRAQMLRKKGFNVRTEEPQAPGDFYLLKVGKFRLRAEAEAMQKRLKKIGFPSLIKTN
jgi:cell division protein FtsN